MHLARSLDAEGGEMTAQLMSAVGQRVELEAVQLLAYRLYDLTQATRPQDALLFKRPRHLMGGHLGMARRADVTPRSAQSTFDFDTNAGELAMGFLNRGVGVVASWRLSNKKKVGRGFGLLAAGLRPFVDRYMASAAPDGQDWVRLVEAGDATKHGVAKTYLADDPRFP